MAAEAGWLGTLLSSGLSGLGGGILGIFGAGIQKWFDYKDKKLMFEERARERTHELAVMDKEAANAAAIAAVKRDEAIAVADANLQAASYATEKPLTPEGTKLSGKALKWALFVDGFARLIRPCTTIYLQMMTTAIATWVFVILWRLGLEAIDGPKAMVMADQLINFVIFQTSVVINWWFGVRGSSYKAK